MDHLIFFLVKYFKIIPPPPPPKLPYWDFFRDNETNNSNGT